MATLIYGFTSLNVADGNSLKEINGALLNDADMALGIYDSKKCFYQLDESSGATESLPDIVSPSLNAGTKRWILKAYLVADITANGLTASKAVFTDVNKKLVSIGTLGVDQGGTGASTLTDHGVLLGSGTDPITALGVMTDGQLVIGSTGADPVVASITAGEGINTTAGAGTLTIACKDASTSNKGVTVYSGSTKAIAGTDTASAMTPADVAAANAVLGREPDQGVAMTYAASGSTGITVADNDNIDFGTGNFTLVWKGSLPDWTPTLFTSFIEKGSGHTAGIGLYVRSAAAGNTFGLIINNYGTPNYESTITNSFLENTTHDITVVVTNKVGAVDGSVVFYCDGVLFGDTVPITTAYTSVNNTYAINLLGYQTTRYAGTTHHAYLFNRALTAAEVLDLYRNGIAPKHRKASQTALTSGTLVAGQEYTIDTFAAGDDFANVGGTNETGNVFVATGTTPTTWTNSSSLRATGGTLILEPEGIQPTPGQWLDSSTNHLDALMPAAGASNTRAIRDGWASYTTGTTDQYIHGGTTRAIFPDANTWIDEIYAYSAGTPTFTLGDVVTTAEDTLVASTTLVANTWTKLALLKNSTTANDIYVNFTAGGAVTQFKIKYHKISL